MNFLQKIRFEPMVNRSVTFSRYMPSIEQIKTKLEDSTGLQFLLQDFEKDGDFEDINIVQSSSSEQTKENSISLMLNTDKNEVSIFYFLNQRYLPNILLWTLISLGGIYKRKDGEYYEEVPNWTKQQWKDVKWWHYATDSKSIARFIRILISCTVLLPFILTMEALMYISRKVKTDSK
ncbi:MAG: hypothetical protein ACJAWV_003919 [Flammeovirgaceae bacterium]|jgi:hypothetical protein